MIIIGLGNPGSKYKSTLHNAGYLLVDWLSDQLKRGSHPNTNAFSIKTSSFMNDSGSDVKRILSEKGVLPDRVVPHMDWILAHDDIDIPLGKFKITFGNTSGGHKGVQSVIDALGTKDFWRIRIGVQLPAYDPKIDKAEDWVLGEFSSEQLEVLGGVFEEIVRQVSKMSNDKLQCNSK